MPKTQDHETSYLAQLKFDPKLEKSTIARYITNFRYVFLLILIIIVVGIGSYIALPRRLNPKINIPIVLISTVLPGAGPQDVESLVTVPLEDSINGVANIDALTSVSQSNVSLITVQFNSGVDPDKARDDIKSQLDSVSTLPKDALDPKVIKLDFENQPVWQFLITTNDDTASLTTFSNNLKEKLKKGATIKDVSLVGSETQEVQVLIKPDAMKSYGIDSFTLSRTIQAAIPSYPSGSLNTDNSSFSLTIDSTVKSIQQLRDLEIIVNGQPVKLSEIAEVTQRSTPSQAKTFWTNAKSKQERAIAFSVYKTDSANIDRAVADAQKIADIETARYDGRYKVVSILDTSELISKQFNSVLESFFTTIILVIATLFVFLGLRQALIVALSIPLSFLITFTVMNIMGLTINFLTLFSLILALGLLVDDAIVVVTAMTAYWRTKKFTPSQTGLLVLRDFIVPIWSTTITAVWAFAPLLLSTGIIGEFIKSIPIVVSTTLLASTAIAVLITLPTTMLFLKPNFPKRVKVLFLLLMVLLIFVPIIMFTVDTPLALIALILAMLTMALFARNRRTILSHVLLKIKKTEWVHQIAIRTHQYSIHGVINSQLFATRYQKLITRLISSKSARVKTLVIVVVFSVFSYTLVPLGFVVNEFFPKADQNVLFLSIELPTGTNLQTSEKEARHIMESLRGTTQLKYVTAQIGQSFDTQNGGNAESGANNILFTINLTDKEKRHIPSYVISDQLRNKFRAYSTGKASVLEDSGGPPAGSDIQIKLLGDDLKILNDYADKIVTYLKKEQGTNNVQKSINPGTSKIDFVPDHTKLAANGITVDQIGNQLRSFSSGFTISPDVKLDSAINEDLVLRQSTTAQNPKDLNTLSIQTNTGTQIPINELGSFRLAQNPTQITREDGKRTISVSAGVKRDFQVSIISAKLEKYAANGLNLPSGYEWKTGGVNEENQKSVTSIMEAMVLAFMLIAATMILQFGSYRKALIVLLVIPLAVSGVFVVFALTGTPLSFPTLIGILALFGIVVYHAMLIVDKINRNLRTTHMNLRQAIADAAASRVEPILFGTITTVVGLIPITLSDPLWRGLGGAIIAGMLFSGIIMLLFIPVVYYEIYKNQEGKEKV